MFLLPIYNEPLKIIIKCNHSYQDDDKEVGNK